jgi:hypothetical protein
VCLQTAAEHSERDVVLPLKIAMMFSFGYGMREFPEAGGFFQLAVKLALVSFSLHRDLGSFLLGTNSEKESGDSNTRQGASKDRPAS